MLAKALVLTDDEADLLGRALEEVKTKFYEEAEVSLDDTQALNTLVSYFRAAEKKEQEKESRHTYLSLGKRLVLGTLLDRPVGAERE
jgi:hypothetical protein